LASPATTPRWQSEPFRLAGGSHQPTPIARVISDEHPRAPCIPAITSCRSLLHHHSHFLWFAEQRSKSPPSLFFCADESIYETTIETRRPPFIFSPCLAAQTTTTLHRTCDHRLQASHHLRCPSRCSTRHHQRATTSPVTISLVFVFSGSKQQPRTSHLRHCLSRSRHRAHSPLTASSGHLTHSSNKVGQQREQEGATSGGHFPVIPDQ
jgi:hypothetical protein